jgi:phosphoglycerate dehydrogenase-like enzyme
MIISAVRRNLNRPAPSFVDVHPLSDLDALLSTTDVLAVTLPLTPKTEGFIGSREIGLLPDSAIVVNVARGAIIDERALFDALQGRRLAAAGLDVWYRYPTTEDERASLHPSEYPFHELDNVVMSPHRGGAFRLEELEARRMRDLAVTLNAIASGGPVPHRVDLEAGY